MSSWHSVTPHTRPLSLSIIELTPLALTLSLTLASPPSPSLHPVHSIHHQHVAHIHNHTHAKQRKKSRHKRHESDDDSVPVEVDDEANTSLVGPNHHLDLSNFKDLLSHGVVVSVNGQPWNRIVAHVSEPEADDEGDVEDLEEADWEDDSEQQDEDTAITQRRPRRARFTLSAERARRAGESPAVEKKGRLKADRDEAVVVVYGLNPGTEYEIELQVLGLAGPEGDVLVSNSVLLPASPVPAVRSRANSLLRSTPASRSNSVSTPQSGRPVIEPASPSALGLEAAATNILNPVDTQAAQIRHMIAAAHAEKDHLQSQIKEARRASQRAEAALRSEIESVKRAIEKAGSMDLRAKQKALALQEQVKQGWAGAEHAEQQTEYVENGMDDLKSRHEQVKSEVDEAQVRWRSVKTAENEVREKDKKMRGEEEKKLAEIVGKVDKLRLKKEKKETEKAELEGRLQELEMQREHEAKRTEEEKYARRSSAYWWDPYVSDGGAHSHGHHGFDAHRGRGGHRYVSGPMVRPNQPSPTSNSFSPAFRPPTLTGSPAATARTPSASGVNVSATPFQPAASYDPSQHTTLMPPQLQHRIYLPSERPRPEPTFNAPPSVIAENTSPSFPPLPGHSPSPDPSQGHSGPSLASIVTRAVLSPTSAALSGQQSLGSPLASGSNSRHSTFPILASPIAGSGAGSKSNPSSPIPRQTSGPGPASNHSSGRSSRHTTFGPPPDRSDSGQLSPSTSNASVAAWGERQGGGGILGIQRTATPPVGLIRSQGASSPLSPAGVGNGGARGQ